MRTATSEGLVELGHCGSKKSEGMASEAVLEKSEHFAQAVCYTRLTTLGYGDIVPVARLARILSIAEAIVGVMYLAIITSRLVGFDIAEQAAAAKRRDL